MILDALMWYFSETLILDEVNGTIDYGRPLSVFFNCVQNLFAHVAVVLGMRTLLGTRAMNIYVATTATISYLVTVGILLLTVPDYIRLGTAAWWAGIWTYFFIFVISVVAMCTATSSSRQRGDVGRGGSNVHWVMLVTSSSKWQLPAQTPA